MQPAKPLLLVVASPKVVLKLGYFGNTRDYFSCSLNHDQALLGAKAASLPCRLGTGQ